ncbi:MAG: M14 family zinc carboxypeptidase [Gemmatimonadaceae bacterium]
MRTSVQVSFGCLSLLTIFTLSLTPLSAQQPIDSAYTRTIRELTPTDSVWNFSTELVDYLPDSPTVPTPFDVLGYVPGTVGKLSYVADINRYFRELARTSPRVKLFSLGESDDGREMLLVAIADEATITRLDDYREMLARLADPRTLAMGANAGDHAERDRLIDTARPIYWLTGAMHSPETGSPEMLLELGYRLAVDESDYVRAIRSNVITLITPVVEVDGRDRMVDVYYQAKRLGLGSYGRNLIYWGKYTAHDNNRDAMVLSQKLTQNIMDGYLRWKPVVFHDLHESVAFLYTSTGTGPYNEQFDPIVVNEWHTLAYQEINELTRRGLPGVWTHGFYDGWAPNYMLAIGNLHNAIGRFYETYTSSGADCHTVQLSSRQTDRRWDRTNPPVNGVRWCIRSNINYQQSGVLIALKYVADNAETFLTNYAAKAQRMVERGRESAPFAYLIPREQRHSAEAADLVNLFRAHGAEVHVATADFELRRDGGRGSDAATRSDTAVPTDSMTPREPSDPNAPVEAAAAADTALGDKAAADQSRSDRAASAIAVHTGDWIVRMDQPYTQTVRTLLARQTYGADDPEPYDDTGWTLDELRHVATVAISDSSVLARPMRMLDDSATVEGTITGEGGTLVVAHLGDWRSAVLPWKIGQGRTAVAESSFTVAGTNYPAGTFILRANDDARAAVRALGMQAVAVTDAPRVEQRTLSLPRIALMHSWLETQNEGWVRYAFDVMGVPYTYIADQDLRRSGALDPFDVVVFPHVSARETSRLINGRPMIGPAIPWKRTDATPNLGKLDATDDIRPGMGLEGAAALRRFVERGGLLIATGNSTRLPIDLGFNPTVSIDEARGLRAQGAIFRARAEVPDSPLLYGYERGTFPVYFNQRPLFEVEPRDTSSRTESVDPEILAEADRQRGRVILAFHPMADSLLISGLLVNGNEMAGKGAIVDAPVGEGHVILFGIRPFWRWETQGSFALALNAIANWNALDAPPPPTRTDVAEGAR